MAIDLEQLMANEPLQSSASWQPADVVLYHLGLGAGSDPTDPQELDYVYEDRLKVLPTFPLVAFREGLLPLLRLPGLSVDLQKVMHAEQEITLHQPVPASAAVSGTHRVAAVHDKGSAALLAFESTAVGEAGPMWTSRSTLHVRDAGGFGGDRGLTAADETPSREPDVVVESPTLPQQALLYRLNGDTNPMHVDPAFAAAAGFPRPILHGLCTYGIVAKAVVDTCLGGDVGAVSRYATRFSGVVYPGETIVSHIWHEEGHVHVRVTTRERGLPVLTRTVLEVAS